MPESAATSRQLHHAKGRDRDGSASQTKGFGCLPLHVAIDGGLKVDNRSEDASVQPALLERGRLRVLKPTFPLAPRLVLN